ncbi:MAG: hypothetical protein AUK37_04260 [Rhodobacterales bacterium CG2_30_65_12]|nr:MAG: hypothetical protein AUK37_04260 [Rhodobacterales bacterium CG2_30_65_12]
MKRKPFISTPRAVEVYREMLWWRRELFDDGEFFKVPDAWEAMCEGINTWKTYTYRGLERFKPKAAMIVFGESAKLCIDERLLDDARKGGKLTNSILAHEIAHLALDHHANSATKKNFQLSAGTKGMSIRPPNSEEFEANLAGVFFQCGVALQDKRLTKLELAHRAFADVELVGLAQQYVQLDIFQRELWHQRTRYERVVL